MAQLSAKGEQQSGIMNGARVCRNYGCYVERAVRIAVRESVQDAFHGSKMPLRKLRRGGTKDTTRSVCTRRRGLGPTTRLYTSTMICGIRDSCPRTVEISTGSNPAKLVRFLHRLRAEHSFFCPVIGEFCHEAYLHRATRFFVCTGASRKHRLRHVPVVNPICPIFKYRPSNQLRIARR